MKFFENQSRSGGFGEEKRVFSLPRIKPRFLCSSGHKGFHISAEFQYLFPIVNEVKNK